ncbi:hypothetical protein QBC37DRAFT_357225 [Rhypophila decipiens]|uniref:Uncharacterized protein n=1 Tax=Rhypophila decipiens TaxID=261697 RepID=A0AAN6XYV3_9PEZI|nr:hypothetical protein QBC37DRAFT_357225 [Rhypophila decipiens]
MLMEVIEFIPSIETARMVACLSWLLLHRTLSDSGFTLGLRGVDNTDCKSVLLIGLTSTLWSAATIKAALDADIGPSLRSGDGDGDGGLLLASPRVINGLRIASHAPIITQVLFAFWLVCMGDVLLARWSNRPSTRLWRGVNSHTPFIWNAGLPPAVYWATIIIFCVAVTVSSFLSIAYSPSTTLGILNLLGLVIFVQGLGGSPRNPYTRSSHWYTDSSLRIALPTSHHEGTMYILPGPGTGIDAVWSPKIRTEHTEADAEIMTLFSHLRADRWVPSEPLERLRTTLAAYQARVRISAEQAERLAAWIYLDKDHAESASLRRIECLRAPGMHLIGRDLMFALCHAEYLVFMSAGRLRPETMAKFGSLRLIRRSGAGGSAARETVGYGRPGLEGYREAVEHVYAMFGLPVDRAAVEFGDSDLLPPKSSFALSTGGSSPAKTIEEYVGQLWDLSTKHSESTFSALYFFTTVWAMEVGNIGGFHFFPLRVRNRDGDVITQLVMWRQAWWVACLSQLVAVSPTMFGLFVAGFVTVS